MANYLEDRELYYQLIISKGKGKLTDRAAELMILVAKNVIRKKERSYKSTDDKNDCYQEGLLHLFSSWYGFNPAKYSLSMPYITEIFKRGMANSLNVLNNRKSYNDDVIRIISIDRANDGKGLHGF
jgi:hypothetical protein